MVVADELEGGEGADPALAVERPELRAVDVLVGPVAASVVLDLFAFGGERFARHRGFEELDAEVQGDLRHRRRLDGLRVGRVLVAGVVDEVGALDGAAADPARVAVRDEALGFVGAHVAAGLVVLELRSQLLMALFPLVHLVDGDGQALVLVVAAVARLGRLVDLGLAGDLHDVLVGAAAVLAAGVVVELLGDREAVGHPDVAVAPEPGEHGRVVAVQVRVVARAPEHAEHAALALDGHVHLLRQAVADQQGLLRESLVPQKAGLALGRVFGVAAVRQGHPGPARRLGHVVHVVLLQLLEVLHVGVQELLSPVGGRRGAVVGLVAGPAQHARGIPVLRPLGLGLFAVPLPGLGSS